MKSTLIMAGALVLAASLVAQQFGGRYGNGRQTQSRQTQPGIDVTKQFVVEGAVAAVHLAYGAQYPSIEIGGKLIKLAPVWFLLENDFEIRAGDMVRVAAAPSTRPGDAYAYALSLLNTKTQASITLRDALGVPAWTGGQSRQASAARNRSGGTACIDPASIQTFAGVVENVTVGAGIQMPALVLRVGADLVTIKIGPERVLLENDFELAKGEMVTVVAAYAACCETYLALSITNADGLTVVLRNEDGTPAW